MRTLRASILSAVLCLAILDESIHTGPFAQAPTRPDSREASYPTEGALPPPAPVGFTAAWEREIPAETLVHLSANGTGVFALSTGGTLFAFETATGAPLWLESGFDPGFAPVVTDALLEVKRAESGEIVRLDPRDGTASQVPPPGGQTAIGEDGSWLSDGDGILTFRNPGEARPRWQVRTGTDVTAPGIVLDASLGAGKHQRSERLAIAGTMDGLLLAYRLKNGHLAWSARASSRISRPIAVWPRARSAGSSDARLLLAGEGSRRIEAFRAIDGAPAGSLLLGPEGAVILDGPFIQQLSGDTAAARCLVAWSPYPPAGSRVLSLRLSDMR